MTKYDQKETIWIIGASSGIGAALASAYTHAGHKVIISARRQDVLNDLAEQISAQNPGGDVLPTYPLDVTDAQACFKTAASIFEQIGRIDRIIIMAGQSMPTAFDRLDLDRARALFDINVMGTLHIIQAVLPLLTHQGFGQLALCGSVAGYRGLPTGQPYCATKAAVINIAESLRCEYQNTKIDIRVINPGFVDTPMTRKNTFPMPMMITADQAASAIIRGLKGRSFEIHCPKCFTYLMKIMDVLPYPLYFWLMRRIRKHVR